MNGQAFPRIVVVGFLVSAITGSIVNTHHSKVFRGGGGGGGAHCPLQRVVKAIAGSNGYMVIYDYSKNTVYLDYSGCYKWQSIPCNLHNEHINKLYKDIIANMGVNFTESASTYAAREVPSLERLVGFGRLASIQKQLLIAGDQM